MPVVGGAGLAGAHTSAGAAARLTWAERAGYGGGDLGGTIFFQFVLLYLFYFYTDVVKIPPAWVATIFIVARIVDAAANPIIGSIADRTRTRWGRYRPYILFGALPLAAATLAAFTVIGDSLAVKIAWATVTYSVFSLCFATVAIPYSALMAVMSRDPHERALLGTLRAGCGFSAGILVSLVVLPLVHWAGGGAAGFRLAVVIVSLVGVPLLLVSALTSCERIAPESGVAPNVREILKAIGTRPLVTLTVGFMLINICALLRSATAIYYFKYNLGREDLVSTYLTFGAAMTLLGILSTPIVSRWCDKRSVMICAMAMMSLGHLCLAVLPQRLDLAFICIGFLPYFGMGLSGGVLWSMIADSVDYADLRIGCRAEGACYGAAIFSQKIAFAVGGALTGLMLAGVGYRPDTTQSAEALRGIYHLVGFVPGVLMLLAAGAAVAYPLSARTMLDIRLALESRRYLAGAVAEPRTTS